MENLTQNKLGEVLDYNPITGLFTWKQPLSSRAKVGKVAGTITQYGYVCINIFGKKYMAHRLVWLYIHGKFPQNDIDHINHKRADNSLINLRECTRSENKRNQKKQANNKSGYKGVCWSKAANKWRAEICREGNSKYLGIFDCPKEAARAYNDAALKLHGEFAHLNEVL